MVWAMAGVASQEVEALAVTAVAYSEVHEDPAASEGLAASAVAAVTSTIALAA